ncbi:MAG: nucleoside triphosphate pyrophosphohydrolase [Rhizobiales bacterium]|nr:nucleoside triphosphate pyrophosphohydrolase [Hyphomicrobiales bacterium]
MQPTDAPATTPEPGHDRFDLSSPGAKNLADLAGVMARLRDPAGGCPWDLEQSFATIAPYTLEEAYEVADAIERGDLVDLQEELGDLLLQVVYHAQMAAEAGAFTLADVVDGITRKMIRRHPHVFGDRKARDAGAVKGMWERIKAEERAEKARAREELASSGAGTADGGAPAPPENSPPAPPRLLASVPRNLPALARASKLQARAAKVGFDWPSLEPVLDKLDEEIGELRSAIASGETAHAAEELGDVLFVLANVARHLGRDGETVLTAANAKFVRRWEGIEDLAAARGLDIPSLDLAALDALWNDVKAIERGGRGG